MKNNSADNLCSGAEHWLKWINRDTGRRSDSAHAYIHSTRAVHSNLHLLCNTKVDKVIIENGRAVGVRTLPMKPLHPDVSILSLYLFSELIRVPPSSKNLEHLEHESRLSFQVAL